MKRMFRVVVTATLGLTAFATVFAPAAMPDARLRARREPPSGSVRSPGYEPRYIVQRPL